MTTEHTYSQEMIFTLQKNRLEELIKKAEELVEKLETRMKEIEDDRHTVLITRTRTITRE